MAIVKPVDGVVIVGRNYIVTYGGVEYVISGGMLDNIYKVGNFGPTEDGDLPSKSGRDALLKLGLLARDTANWTVSLTDAGIGVWEVVKRTQSVNK